MNEEKITKLKEAVGNLLDIFNKYERFRGEFKLKEIEGTGEVDDTEVAYRMTTSLKEKLDAAIEKIIKLEIEGTMYSVNEEKEQTSKKDLKINIMDEQEKGYQGTIDYKKILNEKGEVIDNSPTIEINLGRLTAAMVYSSKEQIIKRCKDITIKNIFHEIQHLRQDEMSIKEESSKNNLLFAKESLICTKDRDLYNENYYLFAIESDANAVAYSKCIEIMGENEQWKIEKAKAEECFSSCEYNTMKKDEQGNPIYKERNDAIAESVDKIMQNEEYREEAFRLYPIMKKEYNKDGTRKTALELITNMQAELTEIKDSKKTKEEKIEKGVEAQEMYFELIYKELEKNEQLEEVLETLGKDKSMKIFSGMQKYFEKEREEKVEKVDTVIKISKKDDKYKDKKEKIKKYYDNKIENIKRMMPINLDKKKENMER